MTQDQSLGSAEATAEKVLRMEVVEDDTACALPADSPWRFPTTSGPLAVYFEPLTRMIDARAFDQVHSRFRELSGSWAIVLDLGFRDLHIDGELEDLEIATARWVRTSLRGGHPGKHALAIVLLKALAQNPGWSGVVAVASTNLQIVGADSTESAGPREFLDTYGQLFQTPERRLVLLRQTAAGGSDETRGALLEALGRYFEFFVPELSLVSHVQFYLSAEDGVWFPQSGRRHRDYPQFRYVRERYPALTNQEEAVGAFYCGTPPNQCKSAVVRRGVPTDLFRAVIPAIQISNELRATTACLPCEPGMAFLLAVAAVYQHLMTPTGNHRRLAGADLRVIDGDSFREGLVALDGCVATDEERYLLLEFLQPGTNKMTSDLTEALKATHGGDMRGLIHAALDCCVGGPGTGVPAKTGEGVPALAATLSRPLRETHGWTLVHPWIGETSIGLTWPYWEPGRYKQFDKEMREVSGQ